MKRFFSCIAAIAALAFAIAAPAFASPLPYLNTPFESPNSAANAVITSYNTLAPAAQYTTSCTGTTTATCQGLRVSMSYTGLTTAATATSAAQTVTDASVAANSILMCQTLGYAGTGNPLAVNVIPAAGSFTYQIQNTHASAALNATVVTACLVYN